MTMKTTLVGLSVLLSATASNTHAALTSYNGADDVGLVYSSVSDVTWTQDANLFITLYDADNTLISQIAGVTPSYNDPAYSLQTIDANDFNTSTGQMSWWGAIAFVNYLSDINYGGSNQWRLPSVGSNPDEGYNQTGSEQGQLFYSELNGTAGSNIPNTATYNNEQADGYWSGTQFSPTFNTVWRFSNYSGDLDRNYKVAQYYVWAVSPGQVPAVPIPGAVWLFGTGLMGLLGLKRRGHSG